MFPLAIPSIPIIISAVTAVGGFVLSSAKAATNGKNSAEWQTVKYGALGLGIATGVIYGYEALEKARKTKEAEEKGQTPGTAEFYAKRIWELGDKDSFFANANESAILELAKEFKFKGVSVAQVAKAFREIDKGSYSKDLYSYLENFMSETEYNEFIAE